MHTMCTVDEARRLLQFTNGATIPGVQKHHMCTMHSNANSTTQPPLQSAAYVHASDVLPPLEPAAFVDLLCTMPCRVCNEPAKALVDTASNHCMITRSFLRRHNLSYHSAPVTTVGVSGSEASCLGFVVLPATIGYQEARLRFTVVDSLPAAAVDFDAPNHVLLANNALRECKINIQFHDNRIALSVPGNKNAPKGSLPARTWHYARAVDNSVHTTHYSSFEEFLPTQKELKSLLSKARAGKQPLFVAHITGGNHP